MKNFTVNHIKKSDFNDALGISQNDNIVNLTTNLGNNYTIENKQEEILQLKSQPQEDFVVPSQETEMNEEYEFKDMINKHSSEKTQNLVSVQKNKENSKTNKLFGNLSANKNQKQPNNNSMLNNFPFNSILSMSTILGLAGLILM